MDQERNSGGDKSAVSEAAPKTPTTCAAAAVAPFAGSVGEKEASDAGGVGEKSAVAADISSSDPLASFASAASGWFSGWAKSLETVKEKSAEVLDMVKKDLGEFSQAVQSETNTILATTSETLRDRLHLEDDSSAASQVKKSVSGFLSHVQKAFTPDTVDDEDAEAYVMRDGKPVLLDRFQTEMYRLAGDPQTFLSDPAETERHRYENWCADQDLEARQPELSDQLASNRPLLDQYTKLVPSQVSHVLFWYRYLYRVHLAEEREKQREQLRQRAERLTSPGQAEKQIAWEEESGGKKNFSDHVELTDAQTDQLLADYDKEIKEKESTSPERGN